MNTTQQEATARLTNSLKNIVRLSLISYNKQSAFYKHCNTPNKHVERMVQFFYEGFIAEVQNERKYQFSFQYTTTTLQPAFA